ncbi:hypothetical protein CEUSTIGMA_g11540.t1 [Chlamydomonas eustigma]|uniref:Vacuolar fusion protein MON1 homolog n=1 Tax=Chlamydomonas eustigma TaxID=1157962 RepID=A0A250XM21_9CHLO|nr:hypothetical protein CEUSTIGMA_g11540.t1 [Chlamydomonas eustigma]|eukprot:GAX84117.1 hypothetical protein CEUSTIGMA_g11540.t1 [Chlamydomonas eustigma]
MENSHTDSHEVEDVRLTETTLRPSPSLRDEEGHRLTSFADLYTSEGRIPKSDDDSDPETINESYNSDEDEQSLNEESEVSKILSALNVSNENPVSLEPDITLPEPSAEALRQRAGSETWQDSENGLRLTALSSQRSLSLLLREGQEAQSTSTEASSADIWSIHPKHYFILSSSGKPMYSYHGDESALAAQMALITALVAVIQDQGDTLHHMLCGSTLIVFMIKDPLILVATSRMGEPVMALQRQLELLYCQVLLVVTTGLERIIKKSPSYDARSLLQGVDEILGSLIRQVRLDPSYLLTSLRPVPMPASQRAQAQQALTDGTKGCPSAHYALLMMGSHVIAADRAKQQPPLEPLDVMLLANFITSNHSYRFGAGEAFCPVCLPGYNPHAYLHAHIDYLDREVGVYLVLLAGSSDTFPQLSAARASVGSQLSVSGLLCNICLRVRKRQQVLETASKTKASSNKSTSFRAVKGGVSASQNGTSSIGLEQSASASPEATCHAGAEELSPHRQPSSSFAVPGSSSSSSSSSSGSTLRESPAGETFDAAVMVGLASHYDAGPSAYVEIESIPRPAGGRLGTTPLWHFMVRFPSRRQQVSSLPCEVLSPLHAQQLLSCYYAKLLSLVHDCPEPSKPNRLVWLADDRMAMLAMLDSELELYIALDPLTDETLAVTVAEALRRHMLEKRVQADLLLP